ncbi:MAG TPA: acyltransferase [Bacteroidia bacterium]|nr:acyltransferase [Bacteroidia bacterium]
MKKYEIVDFLKGYSIFTIVLYHFFQALPMYSVLDKAINIGGTGIHTFLTISGFGLYLSFRDKPLGFVPFIKRRLSKIYIPYIIVMGITALIALFIPIVDNSPYAFLGHVFLYKMFDSAIIGSYGGQFWFISTIIQFYLVFHVLAWFKRNSSAAMFLITGLVLSFGWAAFLAYSGLADKAAYNRFFLQYLWEFMLGMLLADLLKQGKLEPFLSRFSNWHFLILGITGMGIYIIMALKLGAVGQLFNDIPALIGYSCVAIFLYNLSIKPINRFFLYTGEISYSLFLVHILVLLVVMYGWQQAGLAVSWKIIPIPLVISYLVAHFYNKFVGETYKWLKI